MCLDEKLMELEEPVLRREDGGFARAKHSYERFSRTEQDAPSGFDEVVLAR